MKTIYKSFDETLFNNPYDSAKNDLNTNVELLTKIAIILKGKSESYQINWIDSIEDNISYQFNLLDLNHYHWQVWKNEMRGPELTEQIPTLCVIVSKINTDKVVRAKLIDLLKEDCSFPIEDTLAVLRGKKQIIANQLHYNLAHHLCEQFTQLGCSATVVNAHEANIV